MRLKYLDWSKGLAIILMVFAHTMNNENIINTWIFAFHMPIFFIICGIITSYKENGSGKINICKVLKKRLFQLGVPYFVFCMALTVFYAMLSYISTRTFDITHNIISTITLQGIDSLWFIPCFFIAELMLNITIINKVSKYFGIAIAGGTILFISIFSNMIPEYWLLKLALKVLVGYVFVLIGYLMGKALNTKRYPPLWLGLILLAIGSVSSHFNGFVGIGALDFNIGALFFINAVILSFAVLTIFNFIENKYSKDLKILSYFGKNSIVVLCTNNLLIETIRLLDYKLTGNILLQYPLVGSFIFTFILILIEAIIIKIAQGRLGLIFGMKGKKK